MMQKLWIGVAALTGMVLLAGGTTNAVETPEALKCSQKKLKAVGKDWQAKLKCYSKAIKDGITPVDAECMGKAATKITDKFASIEAAGGCATDANLFELNQDAIPDGMLASILNQTNNGLAFGGTSLIYRGIEGPDVGVGAESGGSCAANTFFDNDGDGVVNDGCPANGAPEAGADCTDSQDDDGDTFYNDGCPTAQADRALATAIAPIPASASKCAQKKFTAAGKYASALFKCEAKEAKKNLPDDPECTDKAITKLTDKFAKAEEQPDCQVTDDAEFVASEVFRTFQRIVPNMPRFDGCGNTLLTAGENCDDGNTVHFDACPSDCTIDACTQTATNNPASVHINDATVASVTIEIDYPEGKTYLPGVGFEGDVTNDSGAASFDVLDFEHAVRIVASDASAIGVDIATMNLRDCTGGPPLVGDFTCTVTNATGAGGTPDKTATTTCSVTIP